MLNSYYTEKLLGLQEVSIKKICETKEIFEIFIEQPRKQCVCPACGKVELFEAKGAAVPPPDDRSAPLAYETAEDGIVCPQCGKHHDPQDDACPLCGLPLCVPHRSAPAPLSPCGAAHIRPPPTCGYSPAAFSSAPQADGATRHCPAALPSTSSRQRTRRRSLPAPSDPARRQGTSCARPVYMRRSSCSIP